MEDGIGRDAAGEALDEPAAHDAARRAQGRVATPDIDGSATAQKVGDAIAAIR